MGWYARGGGGGGGWTEGGGGGGGGGDDPSTIFGANLVAWYDAQDIATITKDGGNVVSEWRDKSGNGYDLEIDVGVSVVNYSATSLGGGTKPGITVAFVPFSAPGVALGVSTFGFFFVGKTPSVAAGALVGFQGGATGNCNSPTDGFGCMTNWGDATLIDVWNGDVDAATATVTADTQTRIAAVFNGTTGKAYVDGVAQSPVSFTQSMAATGTLFMGCISVGFGGNKPIGEFVLTKVAPDAGQLAAMETYLSGRW